MKFTERLQKSRQIISSEFQTPLSFRERVLQERGVVAQDKSEKIAHSFAKRVKREQAHGIYLVRGKDTTNRQAWYYLQVDPAKKKRFEFAAKKSIQLTDWGKIIISGYGDKPPQHVKARMKDEYGFED